MNDKANSRDEGRVKAAESYFGKFRTLVEGPNTLGNSKRFWYVFFGVLLLILAYPFLTNTYVAIVTTDYFAWMILALSLSVVWGYTGIFNFGQTAFFGVGGYTFGIVAINLFDVTSGTNIALLASIVIPLIGGVILGYFMFYGRIAGLFVAILTLAVALTLNLVLVRTTGTSIGSAELGGNNGLTNIPDLTLGVGSLSFELGPYAEYYFVALLLIGSYLGLRVILNSYYGYVMIAIREDQHRTEMFGYDIRKMKVLIFAGTGGLAGLAGGLYAAWGNFIDPTIMGLTLASLPIIWATVGGRDTLIGTLIAAFTLQWISTQLSTVGQGYTIMFLGVVFVLVVLFFPEGLIPAIYSRWESRQRNRNNQTNTGDPNGN